MANSASVPPIESVEPVEQLTSEQQLLAVLIEVGDYIERTAFGEKSVRNLCNSSREGIEFLLGPGTVFMAGPYGHVSLAIGDCTIMFNRKDRQGVVHAPSPYGNGTWTPTIAQSGELLAQLIQDHPLTVAPIAFMADAIRNQKEGRRLAEAKTIAISEARINLARELATQMELLLAPELQQKNRTWGRLDATFIQTETNVSGRQTNKIFTVIYGTDGMSIAIKTDQNGFPVSWTITYSKDEWQVVVSIAPHGLLQTIRGEGIYDENVYAKLLAQLQAINSKIAPS